jgi:hypothetical protein
LWRSWWNEDWQGKPKYSEETCSSATLSTINPTSSDPGSNPDCCSGKPVTNRLSYDVTLSELITKKTYKLCHNLDPFLNIYIHTSLLLKNNPCMKYLSHKLRTLISFHNICCSKYKFYELIVNWGNAQTGLRLCKIEAIVEWIIIT